MDAASLHNCLRRLTPHVDTSRIALTGGIAIGLHLDSPVDRSRCTAAGDVDFVAEALETVQPTVTEEFLVSHYHLPQPGYQKFLIQLVDPASRLRLDVFPDSLRGIDRASIFDVVGVPLRVLRAIDILEHKMSLLSAASVDKPVDEKHYSDARRLGVACGRVVPSLAVTHLVRGSFSHDIEETCVRCEMSRAKSFPLAPKQAIFEILGYV